MISRTRRVDEKRKHRQERIEKERERDASVEEEFEMDHEVSCVYGSLLLLLNDSVGVDRDASP